MICWNIFLLAFVFIAPESPTATVVNQKKVPSTFWSLHPSPFRLVTIKAVKGVSTWNSFVIFYYQPCEGNVEKTFSLVLRTVENGDERRDKGIGHGDEDTKNLFMYSFNSMKLSLAGEMVKGFCGGVYRWKIYWNLFLRCETA